MIKNLQKQINILQFENDTETKIMQKIQLYDAKIDDKMKEITLITSQMQMEKRNSKTSEESE